MTGAMAVRTAEPVGFRRVAARSIDIGLALGVAAVIVAISHWRITELITTWPEYAELGVRGALGWEGEVIETGRVVGLQALDDVRPIVVQGFVALVVVVLAYHLTALLWRDRTLGHLVLDLRVRDAVSAGLGRSRAVRRALTSAVLDIGVYVAAWLALVSGRFVLGATLWVIAVAVLLIDAMLACGPAHRSLTDRLSGTAVERADLHRRSLALVRDGAAPVARQSVVVSADAARRALDSGTGRRARAAGARLGNRLADGYRNRSR